MGGRMGRGRVLNTVYHINSTGCKITYKWDAHVPTSELKYVEFKLKIHPLTKVHILKGRDV